MPSLQNLWRLFWSRSRRDRVHREIDEEVSFHVQSRTEELVAEGIDPQEARRQAVLAFGGVEKARECSRDARGVGLVEAFLEDLRFGLRVLRRNPGYAVVAVLTMALGFAATTAMFSVANAVLLQPLPFPGSERVVELQEIHPTEGRSRMSAPDFLDLKAHSKVCEVLGAYRNIQYDLTGGGEPMSLSGIQCDGGYLEILGAKPTHGRLFLPEEEQSGKDKAVLLGHSLWQRRFAGDASVIGKSVRLGDVFNQPDLYTVVGILPAGVGVSERGRRLPEFWIPLAVDAPDRKDRADRWQLMALGRLKPGLGIEAARSEAKTISAQLEGAYPDTNRGWGFDLVYLQERLVRNARPALAMLMGAVGCLLLIACVNTSNLLLARSLSREREFGIRAALGAGRSRLVRQLLTESLVLAALAGVLGGMMLWAGFKLVVALLPGDLPRLTEIGLDTRVFGFALALIVVTGFLFGLVPALRTGKAGVDLSLNKGGLAFAGTQRQSRLQGILVMVEVALSVVLLVVAGLLVESLVRLHRVPLGFQPDHVLAVGLQLPDSRYSEGRQQLEFYQALLSQVGGLPGVVSVGAVRELPVGANRSAAPVEIEGRPALDSKSKQWASPVAVTDRYFPTMGVPLQRGRWFDSQDREGALETALINETMAKRYWPDEDPVGKRFRWLNSPYPWFTVIGVVQDAYPIDEPNKRLPEFFRPLAQFPNGWMTLVIRTTGDPLLLADSVRARIWSLDANLPVQQIRTLEQILSEGTVRPRFYVKLVGAFAALALAMTLIGLYGVMAYGVKCQTREIGIRIALGVSRAGVLAMVLRHGARLLLVGLTIGCVGAAIVTRYAGSLLYGTSPTDPLAFLGACALLMIAGLLACFLPARRAARIDPAVTLRCE